MSCLHRLRIFCLCLLPGVCAGMRSAQAACYSTPTAAIDSLDPASFVSPALDGGGYRITGTQSDPVLGRRWAVIASCSHPEWPVIALPIHGLQASQLRGESSPVTPVIHIGDVVHLWRQEPFLRIETTGVAEENGYPGRPIRVRLLHRSEEPSAAQQQLAGIVRGPADVEMQP